MSYSAENRADVKSYWLRHDPGNNQVFDAIVVGSGAAGGVAAAKLCEQGLRVLVLEAGELPVSSRRPYTKAVSKAVKVLLDNGVERHLPTPILRAGEKFVRLAGRIRQPVQSKLYAWALAPESLVDDVDCPYSTDPGHDFHWFRSRQPGGRLMVPGHGRQYYRLIDTNAGQQGDSLPAWPITASDLEASYLWVERALRLRGSPGDVPVELTEILEATATEQEIMRVLRMRRPQATPVLGSHAAPAAWLDMADAAGQLTCRAGAVVRRVRVGKSGRAEGVEWYDCETQQVRSASAPIVFLCASAIESTRILMMSAGRPGAEAVGMHSPALGRYLMDHAKISGGGFSTTLPGISKQKDEPGRSIYVSSAGIPEAASWLQIHLHPKSPSELRVDILSFAEILPDENNRVTLHPSRVDAFGMPMPHIRFRFSDAQHALAEKQIEIVRQICSDLGLRNVECSAKLAPPGTAVHETGTARMGSDPATSVVDPNNECWDAKGLYVTDGACFPRVGVQNSTLAIMALTARAAVHAAGSSVSGNQGDRVSEPAGF